MALVEEDLPGVSKVRTDFQLREDQGMAHRLQEQEYEEHFNSNVQLRRTARHDVGVAKEFQDKETLTFQQEERVRLHKLREREEQDREHATEMTKKLDEEERKLKERERQDQEHAAKIAQRMEEEEDIRMALNMQDQAMAKKMQESEAKRRAQRLQQEESDARLARQASMGSGRSKGAPNLSDREVQRMKQLQLQGGASKQRSLDAGATGQQRVQDPRTVTSSLPATLRAAPPPPTGLAPMHLPSYDQCVPDGYSWDDGEEPQMDENERVALQEVEDERLAREMLQKEEDERKKRELEDMDFARRMQEEESSSGAGRRQPKSHDQDLEIARKLQQEEEARRRNLQSTHERDMDLARRMHLEEKGATKKRQQGAPAQQDPDVELAMRLQREEVMKHKEQKRHKLAQQKVMEQEKQQQQARQQQQPRQQQQQPRVQQDGSPRLPPSTQKQQPPSRFAGYEVPPFSEEPPEPRGAPRSAPMQQKREGGDSRVPGQQPQQQGMPPDGHPFNSAATSFYSYQPGMAGVQVPRGPTAPASSAEARPSYKRNETGKKETVKKKK